MTGSIARRYAKAIFSLAQEQNSLDQTAAELRSLAAVAADPELASAVANPLLSPAARRAIAKSLAEQLNLQVTTRNFVSLLADHGRLDQLSGIADQFEKLLDRIAGRVRARITSATALDEGQRQSLIDAFARSTGRSVVAETVVDANLLGGVVVEIEGKVYDGSVRTQLERLASAIAGSHGSL